MLRISFIILILVVIGSCIEKEENKANHLVLAFPDSILIDQNIPVFIDGERYTYLMQGSFKDGFTSLCISDDIDITSLSGFELKRLDYFGGIGLFIDKVDSLEILAHDTVGITSQLNFDSIAVSGIDTVQVQQIIRAIQEVGNQFHDKAADRN